MSSSNAGSVFPVARAAKASEIKREGDEPEREMGSKQCVLRMEEYSERKAEIRGSMSEPGSRDGKEARRETSGKEAAAEEH